MNLASKPYPRVHISTDGTVVIVCPLNEQTLSFLQARTPPVGQFVGGSLLVTDPDEVTELVEDVKLYGGEITA